MLNTRGHNVGTARNYVIFVAQYLPPTNHFRRGIVLCVFHKNLQYHVIASTYLQYTHNACLQWMDKISIIEVLERVEIMLEHNNIEFLLFAVSFAFLFFIFPGRRSWGMFFFFNIDNLLSEARLNKIENDRTKCHYEQQQWRGKENEKKVLMLLIFTYRIRLNIVHTLVASIVIDWHQNGMEWCEKCVAR